MPSRNSDPAALNELDPVIIRRLNDNPRVANSDLARSVGLSPSTCLARMRSLKRRGIIARFTVELDTQVLGYTLQALVSVRIRPGPGK